MLNLALICHNHTFQSKIKPTTKFPETLAKQGIPGQNKEKQNNDKSAFYLPRHYLQESLKSPVISRFFRLEGSATTPLLHQ